MLEYVSAILAWNSSLKMSFPFKRKAFKSFHLSFKDKQFKRVDGSNILAL